MKILRSYLAWTLLHWALKAWHSDDPMRVRCAEFVQAMAKWQARYDEEERVRFALQKTWQEKLGRH